MRNEPADHRDYHQQPKPVVWYYEQSREHHCRQAFGGPPVEWRTICIHIENPQIVKACQTVNAFYHDKYSKNLKENSFYTWQTTVSPAVQELLTWLLIIDLESCRTDS